MNKRYAAMLVAGAVAVGGGTAWTMRSDSGSGPEVAVAQGRIVDPPGDAADSTIPGRVDITEASAEYVEKGIAFHVQVREPVDPLTDPNWAADSTFIVWDIDTTGDGEDDWSLEYRVHDGKLAAGAEKISGPGEGAKCLFKPPSYDPATGYTVVAGSSCFENPKTLAYRVGVYYHSDVNNDDAPDFSDTAPDDGFAAPTGTPTP